MDTFLQDIRFAVRTLRTRPGFTLAAIATLALGVGASTAVFSLVDAALLRPLPFAQTDRIVVLWGVFGPEKDIRGASMPEVADWREGNRTLEHLAAYNETSLNLRRGDEAERVEAEAVSPSFFQLLGVRAAHGRTFLPNEDTAPDANPVAVISHELWRTRFSADQRLVGQAITLNDRPFTVVGIMPDGFKGLSFDTDVWIPSFMQSVEMSATSLQDRGNRWLAAIGKLKPGVTLEQAQVDLDGVAGRLTSAYPETNTNRGVQLFTLRQDYLGSTERLLVVVFGAVLLFLLLSCANVTGLQLVRATGRQREIALRFALGAGHGRVVRQLLTEALVLSAAGGVAGVIVAAWGASALVPLIPEGLLPNFARPRVDLRVLAFGIALTTLCGVLFGLVPALRSAKTSLSDSLRDGSRAGASGGLGRIRRLGLQQGMVVAEVAIALVLLIGAGLMLRTFQRELAVSPGFRPEGIVAVRLTLPAAGFDGPARRRFLNEILPKLEEMPGAQAVSISSDLPFSNAWNASVLRSDGQTEPVRFYRHMVSPSFFSTLGIPILRGRAFTPADRDSSPPVVVISQAMANRFWPGLDPIGQRIRIGSTADGPEFTIVGVAGNARFRDLRTDLTQSGVEPDVYFPILQRTDRRMEIAIRQKPGSLIEGAEVRAVIATVNPSIPVFGVSLLADDMKVQTASARFGSVMLTVFGVVALLLAAIGIYGVIAFVVGLSGREIAVRMALGADSRGVIGLVMRNGMVLAVLGLIAGLLLSTLATRALTAQLFGVEPLDPPTFIAMAFTLLVAATAAILIPARRATKVDPQIALKAE
ncbi:MAG TPA: ABC transporter permease [Gemmatimonadaceae bacterium]|nr:ABC transporter permease [Gemmatimonadaceae bacterium]